MKPVEVAVLFIGLAGLGVGGFALYKQLRTPPAPPAANPGTAAVTQVRPSAPGVAAAGQGYGYPPGYKGGSPSPQDFIQGVTQTVGGVVQVAQQLGSLFSSFNF